VDWAWSRASVASAWARARAIRTGIDLEEQVARAHVPAFREAHAHDLAAGLRLQRHRLVGLDGGDGVQVVGHAAQAGLRHRHRHAGGPPARCAVAERAQPGGGGEADQGEEEAGLHDRTPSAS
jgi:hypothetical protein